MTLPQGYHKIKREMGQCFCFILYESQSMTQIRIFIQIYRSIPQKNRRIFLISNLQENFRKIASGERNDETREFEVNTYNTGFCPMSQRQPLE